tara:strand:+ start:12475 stop:14334 length:1860 start_codon:yes stop_codon:yes gene_type:complete
MANGEKVIRDFNLDTSDIKAAGEIRTFEITGDSGAVFSLQIKNGNNYYNFQTNLFQSNKTGLTDITINKNSYTGNITFPKVAAGAQYDIFLFSETNYNTKHASYVEVRSDDGSIDINSSTGSNSNLVQKVIYQTLDVTITISGFSPNSRVTGSIEEAATITASRGKNTSKIPFTLNWDVTSTRTLTINRQPTTADILAFAEATIGDPVNITGEDIYPTVTAANKVVNGAVTSGTNVTMDDDYTGLWAVGDRITGNAALDARTQETAVTVTAVNVGSNAKVFTMSEAIAIADDETLSFSNRRNHRWEISSTSFDVGKITPGMRTSEGVKIAQYLQQTTVLEGEKGEYKVDNVRVPALDTLNQKPISSRNGTTKVLTTTTGSSTNPVYVTFNEQAKLVYSGTTEKIFSYGAPEIKRLTGYDLQFSDLTVTLKEIKTTTTAAVNDSLSLPVSDRAGIMDGISTVQGIGIDTTVRGTDTADGAVTSGVKVVMDSNVADKMVVGDRIVGNPVLDQNIVTVAALNPDDDNVKEFSMSEAVEIEDNTFLTFISNNDTGAKVVSGAGSVTGAGTIVLSAAQTLEDQIQLTFPGASTTATITGNIKINKVGNEDLNISFDLEKLLTMH